MRGEEQLNANAGNSIDNTIKKDHIVWQGKPSQWVNFPTILFYSVLISALLYGQAYFNRSNYAWDYSQYMAPINLGIYVILVYFVIRLVYKVLQVYYTKYELTEERLIEYTGITGFFQTEETLELYNIYDYQFPAPLFLSLCRRGSLRLLTHDASQPVVNLIAIRERKKVYENIRLKVEDLRIRKKGYFNDPAA